MYAYNSQFTERPLVVDDRPLAKKVTRKKRERSVRTRFGPAESAHEKKDKSVMRMENALRRELARTERERGTQKCDPEKATNTADLKKQIKEMKVTGFVISEKKLSAIQEQLSANVMHSYASSASGKEIEANNIEIANEFTDVTEEKKPSISGLFPPKIRKMIAESTARIRTSKVNTREQDKFIHFAKVGNVTEMKKLFTEHKGSKIYINALGTAGLAPIHAAASQAGIHSLEYLFRIKAEPDILTEDGKHSLDLLDSFATDKKNMANPSNVERCRAMFSKLSLFKAAQLGYTERVEWLLDLGSHNVSDSNWYGMTALHYAVLGEHWETCVHLLSRGGSLQAKNNVGQTALQMSRTETFAENLARHFRRTS